MFCGQCGAEVADAARFCGACGQPVQPAGAPAPVFLPVPVYTPPRTSPAAAVLTLAAVAAGVLAGGYVGFLLRPSAFLIGQLPFDAVITRGASLTGFDAILIPTAQQSFNIMMAGAVLGALGGFLFSRWLAARQG